MGGGPSQTTSSLLGYPEFGRSPPPPKQHKPFAGVIDLTTYSQDDPPSGSKASPPAAAKSPRSVFVRASVQVVQSSVSTAPLAAKAWEVSASMPPRKGHPIGPQDPTQKAGTVSGPYGPGWSKRFNDPEPNPTASSSRLAKPGAQAGGRLFNSAVASTHKPQKQQDQRDAIKALPSSRKGVSSSKRSIDDEDDEETQKNERAGAAKIQSLQVKGGANDKGKGKAVEPSWTIKGKGKAKAKATPRANAASKAPDCITLDSSDDDVDDIENADDDHLPAIAPPLVPPPSKRGKLLPSSRTSASASSPDPLALGRPFNLTGDAGPSRAPSHKLIEEAHAVIQEGSTKRKIAAYEPGNESFDAPPSAKRTKAINQMKTRDGGSRTVDGLSMTNDIFGKPSLAPGDPMREYAIEPYRYDKLFPLMKLDSPYSLVFNRNGPPTAHTITLRREENGVPTELASFKRTQLKSMTLCNNPENAIFMLDEVGLSIRLQPSVKIEDVRALFEALEKWAKPGATLKPFSQSGGNSACREFDQALNDAREEALRLQGVPSSQLKSAPPAKKTQQMTLDFISASSTSHSPHGTRSKGLPPKPCPPTPPRPPLPKPNEPPLETVVLVWPFGDNVGTGSVTVTHGDTRRLADGEFLNDTLIEFGLKRIFISLEQQAPQLASKVHMFNSFFYKKLSTKKPPKAPADYDVYQTVKKWTQKFDFFDKDYIIVPINEHLHWYLAIIVNPAAILTFSQEAPPARRTRASDAADSTSIPATDAMETDGDDDESANPPGFDDAADAREALLRSSTQEPDAGKTSEEALVAGVAHFVLEDQPMADVEREHDHAENGALSVASLPDAEQAKAKALSLVGTAYDSEEEVAKELVGDPLKTAPEPEDPISVASTKPTLITPSSRPPGSATPQGSSPPEASTSGLSRADADLDSASTRLAAQLATASDSNVCYIFTFDSLGGNHNPVVKRLKDYLVKEALDKKKIEVTITPANCVAKTAIVPQQSNFHDCGVYLLHMVEHFLVDPLDKVAFILRKKGVQPKDPEILETWKGTDAMARRKVMRDEVQQECVKWAEYRKPFVEIEAKVALEKAKKREARKEKEEKEANDAAARRVQEEEERSAAESRLSIGDGKKDGSKARKVDKGKAKEIEQVVISDEESSSPAKEAYDEQEADHKSSRPFDFPLASSSKPLELAGKSTKPSMPLSSTSPTTASRLPPPASRLPPRGVQISQFGPPRLLRQSSPELGHSTTGHVVDSADRDLPTREHAAVSPPPPSHPPSLATRPLADVDPSGLRSPSASPKRRKKAAPYVEVHVQRRSTPPPKATSNSASGGTHTRFSNGDKVVSPVALEEENVRSTSIVVESQAVDSIFDGPSNSQAGRELCRELWGEEDDEIMVVEPVAPAAQPPASALRGSRGRKGALSPELGVEAASSVEGTGRSAVEKKEKGLDKEKDEEKDEGRAWGQKGEKEPKGEKAQDPETIVIDDD